VIKLALVAVTICCMAGAAAAQGFGFGFGSGGPYYPAEPQYQYPFNERNAYPSNGLRAQSVERCPKGQVRQQGKCRAVRVQTPR
jgi:hypothetical protein